MKPNLNPSFVLALVVKKKENQKYFEKVKAHQTEIDTAFGEPLDWDDNQGVKKCSIHKSMKVEAF